MDDFARRSVDDRRAYIGEAASRRDLRPIIIEKDFWVCWTLRRLMACEELSGHLMFKGGTSLSKAYDVIHRFSEDIDLTIAKNAPLVRDVGSPMEADISGKERQRRTKALKEAAEKYVSDVLKPVLVREIEAALGTKENWDVVPDPDARDSQTLLFHYPRDKQDNVDDPYVKPRIMLEFGARGDTEPSELKTISPYLAEEFPDDIPNAATEIPTLAATRTFWEKATILHALHHSGKLRDGLSRHYYDTLMLDRAGIAEEARHDPELLAQVVRNKSLMFADRSASYETAIIGSLRLLPSDEITEALKRDYADMDIMFMGDAPSFDELMEGITDLEERLNTKE